MGNRFRYLLTALLITLLLVGSLAKAVESHFSLYAGDEIGSIVALEGGNGSDGGVSRAGARALESSLSSLSSITIVEQQRVVENLLRSRFKKGERAIPYRQYSKEFYIYKLREIII